MLDEYVLTETQTGIIVASAQPDSVKTKTPPIRELTWQEKVWLEINAQRQEQRKREIQSKIHTYQGDFRHIAWDVLRQEIMNPALRSSYAASVGLSLTPSTGVTPEMLDTQDLENVTNHINQMQQNGKSAYQGKEFDFDLDRVLGMISEGELMNSPGWAFLEREMSIRPIPLLERLEAIEDNVLARMALYMPVDNSLLADQYANNGLFRGEVKGILDNLQQGSELTAKQTHIKNYLVHGLNQRLQTGDISLRKGDLFYDISTWLAPELSPLAVQNLLATEGTPVKRLVNSILEAYQNADFDPDLLRPHTEFLTSLNPSGFYDYDLGLLLEEVYDLNGDLDVETDPLLRMALGLNSDNFFEIYQDETSSVHKLLKTMKFKMGRGGELTKLEDFVFNRLTSYVNQELEFLYRSGFSVNQSESGALELPEESVFGDLFSHEHYRLTQEVFGGLSPEAMCALAQYNTGFRNQLDDIIKETASYRRKPTVGQAAGSTVERVKELAKNYKGTSFSDIKEAGAESIAEITEALSRKFPDLTTSQKHLLVELAGTYSNTSVRNLTEQRGLNPKLRTVLEDVLPGADLIQYEFELGIKSRPKYALYFIGGMAIILTLSAACAAAPVIAPTQTQYVDLTAELTADVINTNTATLPPTDEPPTETVPAATNTNTPTEAPSPTPENFTLDFFDTGDCSNFPLESQLDGNAFLGSRNYFYGCVRVDSLPEGTIPYMNLRLAGTKEDGGTADLTWWGMDEVFTQGNSDSDSIAIYNSEKGVVEFRIGLKSADLLQSQALIIDSLQITPYYPVSIDPATEEPVIVLKDILASYRHQRDKHELKGAPSRSPLDESFNVPKGWGAHILNPTQYQGIWGIALSGEDVNGVISAFLLQQGTQTEDGDTSDAVRYVSIDGTTITDVCALTMGDLPGRDPNWSLDSITSAPDGSIYLRAYQGLLIQVFPHAEETQPGEEPRSSLVKDGVPVCANEAYGLSGGLWPLTVIDEGIVGYDDTTKAIYLLSKGEERQLIADGFGRLQKDSAALLKNPQDGQQRLFVWDDFTGMHEINLKTGQDKVIIPPRKYIGGLSLDGDHNLSKIYYYEDTGTLHEYDLTLRRKGTVSETTECIWHPENFSIKSDGSAIIGVDGATGGIYSYNFTTDNVTFLQKPSNTPALDVAEDGTIFAGYTGCQGSGFIKKTALDGLTALFYEGLPVQVRKLKIQGDLIYVLGINALGWEILDPELTVLNQAGEFEYSVKLPSKSYDNLSVLLSGNALLCDHWRNSCVEAGRDGIIREFNVNFNVADPSVANQTPDQPMSMTNQAPDGSIYAYLGFYRGIVNNKPLVDRYIMEFDVETRVFTPLFETQDTFDAGSVIPLDSYYSHEGEPGLFFITGPVPMVAHHVSPEGLDYLRSGISSNNIPSLKNLIGKKIDNIPIIEVTARGLPQDAWGIGARMTNNGQPYAIFGSSMGYLQFSEIP